MDNARWQKIEELYNSTVEIAESQRLEYLAEECGGDKDLFREVASLLGATLEADGFLSRGGFEIGLQVLADPGQVLRSGQQFGHFTITELLGRGGMGEVYLAEDARLKRMVALKVLPSGFGGDEESVRRLMQEAKTASVLNHPNILTIYDVGEIGERNFIASEYIEGQTLRSLLKNEGPLTVDRTVKIFSQISAALAAAHHAGVVHRDIKPENVMIRGDGLVKVLDFGLAKPVTDRLEAASDKEGRIPTNPGIILGTVSYMSPEQVRGRETDARSDIWSLGVVLCEMLTGNLPFEGETSSDKIAAILKSEPDLPIRDAAGIPDRVESVIARALEKSPSDRFPNVEMMANQLEAAGRSGDSPAGTDSSSSTGYLPVADTGRSAANLSTGEITARVHRPGFYRRTALITAATAFAIGSAVIGTLYLTPSPASSGRMTKARVVGSGNSVDASISPDGRFVAHVVLERGLQSLQLKDLETGKDTVLIEPGQQGPGGLKFSKDSKFVYFLKYAEQSDLYRIPVRGGSPERVAGNVDSGISFSPDGSRFAFIRLLGDEVTALVVRNPDGSEQQLAVREGKVRFGTNGVSWSPDGKVIAAAVNEERGMSVVDIALYPVEGGEPRLIAPENWKEIQTLEWVPDGTGLVAPALVRNGENYVQIWFFPADGGPAEAVTDELIEHHGVSLTADGKNLLTVQWQNRINVWKLPGGRSEGAGPISNSIHARYRALAVAPDGRIVFPSNEDSEGNRDIWIMNPDGSSPRKLTVDQGNNILPCVTSDGRYIVVASNRTDKNNYHLWRMNIDGSDPRQLTFGKGERGPVCPPDPSAVYFHTGTPAQGMQVSRIGRVSIEGGEIEVLTDYPSTRSSVSPDGKFIASVIKIDPKSPAKIGIIPITGGAPVKTFELQQLSFLRWRPDGTAITFTRTKDGVGNFWEQPVAGGQARQVTNFAAETITNFEWSAAGDLICTRGYEINDPVLLTNFR